MPHKDFDALRRDLEREHDPFTFTLHGHTYTTVVDPSLGDSFDLMDAPEPMDDEPEAVRALARFIRRMLIPKDQKVWDQALYSLRPEHGPLIIAIGMDLAEQHVNRPTVPPSESSDGRLTTGQSANEQPATAAGGTASTP